MVQFSATFGRSITANFYLSIGMISHVRSDKFQRSVLCRVDNRLTLTEENGGLQVGNRFRLHVLNNRLGLVVAVIQCFLQVSDLTILFCQTAFFTAQVTTKAVDLSIQTIDFRLITKLCNREVVRTVRVSETIDQTSIKLNTRLIEIVFQTTVTSTVKRIHNSGLNIELELFSSAKVQSKVDSSLRGKSVYVFPALVVECVHPTEAIQTDNFERTRLTFVATEPVAEVNSCQSRAVNETYERTIRCSGLVREVSIAFNCHTKYGRKVTTDTQTCVRVEVMHPSNTCCVSCYTTINSNVEIVESFAFSYCLCRN